MTATVFLRQRNVKFTQHTFNFNISSKERIRFVQPYALSTLIS